MWSPSWTWPASTSVTAYAAVKPMRRSSCWPCCSTVRHRCVQFPQDRESHLRDVPFRFVAGGLHPDHDTLAHFRKTFLAEIKELFVQVLLLAQALVI